MKKPLLFLLLSFCTVATVHAQSEDCNKLGAWLWFIDITGFDTHAQIADTLSALGVKRIYVKVADGSVNTTIWPELIDTDLIDAYQARGLEVWAWSYNYPGNSAAQAEALYMAAETGYEGFVVDVEVEFDGDSTNLHNLFEAFHTSRDQALADGLATELPLYCTTWGNPIDHDFRLDVIDPFVDAYMPQTYVEVWGSSFITNLSFWIDVGNDEYESLGATKPIHHICATESGAMTSDQINEFIGTSGPETSLWRIPGGGTPLSIWEDWNAVDWAMDFCAVSTSEAWSTGQNWQVFPNPFDQQIRLEWTNPLGNNWWIEIYNALGQRLFQAPIEANQTFVQLDLPNLNAGLFQMRLIGPAGQKTWPLVKTGRL